MIMPMEGLVVLTYGTHGWQYRKAEMFTISARSNATHNLRAILQRLLGILRSLVDLVYFEIESDEGVRTCLPVNP